MAIPVCVCIGSFVVDVGELCIAPGLQDLRDIVVFTSDGTFTKATYPWLARVRVRVIGGGGGSGGCAVTFGPPPFSDDEVSAGSGGGGGGYAESVIEADELGATETVTVGAAGAGAAGAEAGQAGERSAFGRFAIAGGGAGGAPGTNATGTMQVTTTAGGVPIAGEILGYGGDGEPGLGRGDYQIRKGGSGGGTCIGGGRAGRGSTGNGLPGRLNSGEGGCAGTNSSGSAAKNGGAGAAGQVIVELYG